MNIKRAKQEIKDAIEAYLARDAYGEYQIPSFRQRPVLLIGRRESEKRRLWNRLQRSAGLDWWRIPSPTTPGKAPSGFPLSHRRSLAAEPAR